jgi:hypothetical protein
MQPVAPVRVYIRPGASSFGSPLVATPSTLIFFAGGDDGGEVHAGGAAVDQDAGGHNWRERATLADDWRRPQHVHVTALSKFQQGRLATSGVALKPKPGADATSQGAAVAEPLTLYATEAGRPETATLVHTLRSADVRFDGVESSMTVHIIPASARHCVSFGAGDHGELGAEGDAAWHTRVFHQVLSTLSLPSKVVMSSDGRSDEAKCVWFCRSSGGATATAVRHTCITRFSCHATRIT